MKKLAFGFVFSLFLLPVAASADAGDNCAIDIASGASDTVGWENNIILKGADGSAWQRAVLSYPKEKIDVEELKPVKIQGMAVQGSDVYVFLFSSQKNEFGGMMRPSDGTCFEAGTANSSGYFSLDFNSAYLWGNIDEKIIVDAFYKLDVTWDEIQARRMSSSSLTYTYIPPQEVQVNAVVNAGDGIGLLPLPPQTPQAPIGPGTSSSPNPSTSPGTATSPAPSSIPAPPAIPPAPGSSGTPLAVVSPTPSTSANPTIVPPVGSSPSPGGGSGIPGQCPSLCGGQEIVAKQLDPASADASIIGKNFDAVGGQPIVMGRLPGVHTFYTGFINDAQSNSATREDFQAIALKALSMELVKRGLLGMVNARGVAPGISSISASSLIEAANGEGSSSERSKEIAFLIHSILVSGSSANRVNQVASIPPPPPPPPPIPSSSPSASASTSVSPSTSASPTTSASPSASSSLVPPPPPPPPPGSSVSPGASPSPSTTGSPSPSSSANPTGKPLLGRSEAINRLKAIMISLGKVDFESLFPSGVSEDKWADTFLQMLTFWTGGSTVNTCMMADDLLTDRNFKTSSAKGDRCELENSNGASPILLLKTDAPVTLIPAFNDTKIVSAKTPFSISEAWVFPAGEKSPLAYRYAFSSPFTEKRAGSVCVKKSRLPLLLSALEKKYDLDAKETTVLAQELSAEFPQTSGFVKLSLANPADIASRFVWLGDGKQLSLFQLFFEFTPGACTAESLTPPTLTIPADRDGFEVGILES